MSKGEKLGVLLEKADKVHHDMNMIFIHQGMDTPELSALPEEEREAWFALKEASDKLASEINRVIMSN